MGYNDNTGTAYAGGIYYDGYTTATNKAVNFDTFNNEAVEITDSAVTVAASASMVIASAILFAF